MQQKRKRGDGNLSPSPDPARKAAAAAAVRPTRQTPVYPPPIPTHSPPKLVSATPVPLPVFPTSPVQQVKKQPQPQKQQQSQRKKSGRMSGIVATSGGFGKENIRPAAEEETPPQFGKQVQQQQQLLQQPQQQQQQRLPATRVERMIPPSVTPVPAPKPPVVEKKLSADRNIDMVVLGNLCFKTWYPSYYGKEVLGDTSGNSARGAKDYDAKHHKKGETAMLDRLYVCPHCFKYAKEIVTWWGHLRACEQKGTIPGRKIYTHPRGVRKVLVAQERPGVKKRRGEGVRYVEEVVRDEGEWSVWEADGEVDGLFCQNLSLFAKLFLDNKSVFFDVTGFNYLLLVYTPPVTASTPTPIPQVTGFFSKEKMSWDNNNLACILVFPPWQRKGLGALLMGVSYEISQREGILGGPEKPISDLGKKGYRRFWTGEIARWLLELDVTTDSETIIDVDDVSRGTWIFGDDCLGVLREMGIMEDGGIGAGKAVPVEPQDEDEDQEQTEQEPKPVKTMPRVRVDKEAIRRHVALHRINLEKVCDPDGFAEGYALPEVDEDEEEAEEEDEDADEQDE
ncbi:hypothetical protein VHEMI10461 [[Torrubiella] hemipterigena]|uniref:histone acetyltransferase n=1 Tax=[Torrubiella] hemipterigena TaxID=1531966 RepID=A0A0A1TTB5_9HYPO|nr:hypothetical protein VHEMI10461 [[Torrubiella] hemipterigena]